jgi:hypothetical protein
MLIQHTHFIGNWQLKIRIIADIKILGGFSAPAGRFSVTLTSSGDSYRCWWFFWIWFVIAALVQAKNFLIFIITGCSDTCDNECTDNYRLRLL